MPENDIVAIQKSWSTRNLEEVDCCPCCIVAIQKSWFETPVISNTGGSKYIPI